MLADGISTLDDRSPEVVMIPNETYWNPDRIPQARIVYDNAISKEEALHSVESGDGRVDIVMEVSPDEAKAFKASAHGKIQSKVAKTILTGVFNRAKASSPFNDVEVRRALNMAIDRQKIIETGAHGYGTVIPAFIQPGRYGADKNLVPYAHDVAKAKAVLEAKIPGKSLKIVASPTYAGVVDAIATCMKDVGIAVEKVITRDELPEDYDIKLVWWFDWSPQFPVGVVHREFFGEGNTLGHQSKDAGFDDLYKKLCKTPHEPAQEHLVQEVERYVYDNALALFLYSPHRLFAVTERVHFVPYDTCMSELAETKVK